MIIDWLLSFTLSSSSLHLLSMLTAWASYSTLSSSFAYFSLIIGLMTCVYESINLNDLKSRLIKVLHKSLEGRLSSSWCSQYFLLDSS